MSETSFLLRHFRQARNEFARLAPDQRAQSVRVAIPDLHFFFDEGLPFDAREIPMRTQELATSLHRALERGAAADDGARTLRERIITDTLLRNEADRDQNVYLGKFFTRTLTRAVPDLIFQPVSSAEVVSAMTWARDHRVPTTLRGAASTAMGGAVPNDGGLALDFSRLDCIDIDAGAGTCVIGAGARLRIIHARLAERGLALPVYPSNLGGTLAGWFLTGGIGLNAFGNGRALDHVRAASVILPAGEHVCFHADGRFEVWAGVSRETLTPTEATAWFRARRYAPMTLADLAGSEGAFGALVDVTVGVEPLPEIGAFLLAFGREADSLAAVDWLARLDLPAKPANVKFLSTSHVHHTRRVWSDEDAKDWRTSTPTPDAGLPWRRIVGPKELGASCVDQADSAAAYLFVDFLDLDAARGFARRMPECPGAPRIVDHDSVRLARERFKPQQTKRLGPGFLAAEILMPTPEVPRFLPRAAALARNAGSELDAEVYYLRDASALVIGGYLADHRSGSFAVDLMIAPALLDLAMRSHAGKPYVLGRWQSPYFERKFGRDAAERLRFLKESIDEHAIVNRGVLTGPRLRGALGVLIGATLVPGVMIARHVYQHVSLAWTARIARHVLSGFSGPAHGRGRPAEIGAAFTAQLATPGSRLDALPATDSVETSSLFPIAPSMTTRTATPAAKDATVPEDRALHCVNCGECNTVCPVFEQAKIRLPQMLTHLGESMRAGERIGPSGATLLDLCMRCGNCEQVCQAGIPHLPIYERLQAWSDQTLARDVDRHTAIVAAVRGSQGYLGQFLGVRPGGYQKRSPASLPGVARFLVLRAEADAGPAATCVHCGACVAVCPTHANREFEGADPRWITTAHDRCIGCGTCVEVCPSNHTNGGQTLRVVEAPAADWFAAIEEYEAHDQPLESFESVDPQPVT